MPRCSAVTSPEYVFNSMFHLTCMIRGSLSSNYIHCAEELADVFCYLSKKQPLLNPEFCWWRKKICKHLKHTKIKYIHIVVKLELWVGGRVVLDSMLWISMNWHSYVVTIKQIVQSNCGSSVAALSSRKAAEMQQINRCQYNAAQLSGRNRVQREEILG